MHVVSRWGTRRSDRVSKLDVTQMLQEVAVKQGDKSGGKGRGGVATGGPVAAENVLKVLRAMYNWALDHDIVEMNPAMRANGRMGTRSSSYVHKQRPLTTLSDARLEVARLPL